MKKNELVNITTIQLIKLGAEINEQGITKYYYPNNSDIYFNTNHIKNITIPTEYWMEEIFIAHEEEDFQKFKFLINVAKSINLKGNTESINLVKEICTLTDEFDIKNIEQQIIIEYWLYKLLILKKIPGIILNSMQYADIARSTIPINLEEYINSINSMHYISSDKKISDSEINSQFEIDKINKNNELDKKSENLFLKFLLFKAAKNPKFLKIAATLLCSAKGCIFQSASSAVIAYLKKINYPINWINIKIFQL